MSMLPPSLPILKDILGYAAIEGTLGYLCGVVGQTNPALTTTIFVTRCVAHALFYHIANFSMGAKDLESQKIFLVNSTLVNMTFLIALRELNLIGHFSSCLIGIAALGYLINRVGYIQKEERSSILKGIKS